jgi:hypothetical protein
MSKGASAFPHSNDVMQIGILGMVPFIAGKYGAEILGDRMNVPFLEQYSNTIGFASAAVAEALWLSYIGPRSPYFNHGDNLSHVKGIIETGVGASLAYWLANLIKR